MELICEGKLLEASVLSGHWPLAFTSKDTNPVTLGHAPPEGILILPMFETVQVICGEQL